MHYTVFTTIAMRLEIKIPHHIARDSNTAMSNRGPRTACRPVEGFVRPSLRLRCSKSILHLTTCPYFDSLEFDIFDAGGPQCLFITPDIIAVKIRTLSVY